MQFVCKDRHFLDIMSGTGMLKRFFLSFLMFLCALTAFSKPARPGRIYLFQPDGSGFHARFYGDEMMRIKVTDEGAAIVQDKDGWWCYAEYDAAGSKTSTGCRVGNPVSPDILQRSCNIPLATLSASRSAEKARVMEYDMKGRKLLSGIRAGKGTRTETDAPVQKFGLVILVQFKGENESFTYKKDDFINLLMQEGYSEYGAEGSVKEYFDDVSKVVDENGEPLVVYHYTDEH
mgnify:CR=1 FL=1